MSGWTLEIPSIATVFECDRLRRERHELIGELIVRCAMPGARTVNGILSTGDFNFSSVRARQDRAKLLAQRAGTNGNVDWFAHLEEFAQGVFERERQGDPVQDIWSIPKSDRVDDFAVDGIALPRKHPAILFGDGGCGKSLVALYLAGKLAQQGVKVALFDWELSGDEHRERMERLFRFEKPALTYCRCESPLTNEIDRIYRIVRDHQIVYGFFDSVSFACDGRPEEAEVAARYFRALRTLQIGGLHIAHVNRNEDHDKKPFGSSWWHNGARSTWFVKADESGSSVLNLGFFHRKSNLGPLRRAVSLKVTFGPDFTRFDKANIGDSPELAEKMKLWQRMQLLFEQNQSPKTCMEIAELLDVKVDTVRKTSQRKDLFRILQGKANEQDKVCLLSVI